MISAAFTAAQLFAAKIPQWVWIALAVVALLIGGYFQHQHAIHKALAAEYVRGGADRDKAWQKRLDEEHAAALVWKGKAEAAQSKINTEIGISHEKDVHAISARADDQRLRGPGAAAAPSCGSGRVAGVSSASPGLDPAGRSAGASVAGLSPGERLAVVPWDDLVTLGAGSDEWRSEALTWREWYARQAEANAAARATLGSK